MTFKTILMVLITIGPLFAQGNSPDRSIFVRIFPDRMEPGSITVKPGPLRILTQNRSTAPNVTLSLDQVNGGNIRQVQIKTGNPHSIESYVLPPGDYVLSAPGHPTWVCRITVH